MAGSGFARMCNRFLWVQGRIPMDRGCRKRILSGECKIDSLNQSLAETDQLASLLLLLPFAWVFEVTMWSSSSFPSYVSTFFSGTFLCCCIISIFCSFFPFSFLPSFPNPVLPLNNGLKALASIFNFLSFSLAHAQTRQRKKISDSMHSLSNSKLGRKEASSVTFSSPQLRSLSFSFPPFFLFLILYLATKVPWNFNNNNIKRLQWYWGGYQGDVRYIAWFSELFNNLVSPKLSGVTWPNISLFFGSHNPEIDYHYEVGDWNCEKCSVGNKGGWRKNTVYLSYYNLIQCLNYWLSI